MNKKVLLAVNIFLFLLLAQNSWAVKITYVSGNIYAETKTDYLSGGTWSASGWDASGEVFTDKDYFDEKKSVGVYGYASGQKINGQGSDNYLGFILSSTSQSANGMTGQAFHTQSTVRSGPDAGDMITFKLTPESEEEEGQSVELTAQAILAGTLNSSGLTFLNPAWESGEAVVDFTFKIYKDPTQEAVMSFEYSDRVKNESPTQLMEKSKSLPGLIGETVDSGTFVVGDKLYVYFEQTVRANVSNSPRCSAKAFAIQFADNMTGVGTDKVIQVMSDTGSISINAQVIPEKKYPSIIELDQFTAVSYNNQIAVTWNTLSEIDNAGFNLWRSEAENGKYIRINPHIIGAEGGATLGAEYAYSDDTAKAHVRYYYKLEDIDTRGVSTFHGPISTSIPTPQSSYLPYYRFECYPLWSPLYSTNYPF